MEVYFDNSATTKPYEEVVDAVADTMRNYFGNPSSAHHLGIMAEQKMSECRDTIAKTINCSKDEIIFTSGGSESNNFAIKGFTKAGAHIITTRIEHPSVINVYEELENEGVRVTYLDLDAEGKISIDRLMESLTKDTVLVSVMHVNNEVGCIQDIEIIGKVLKEKSNRAKFHVDAVQSYCKIPINVKEAKIDLLSASGHKIHGPRGSGFIYLRKGLMPKPLIYGGGQERNHRSGTENLAAIAGFAVAAQKTWANTKVNYEKVSVLKSYFIQRLKEIENVNINSFKDNLPYILSASFLGIKSEVLLRTLDDKGIYVSAGSACAAKGNKESHVLKALGLRDEEIRGTIRFSFNAENTKEEIDYTIEVLKESISFLRRLKK